MSRVGGTPILADERVMFHVSVTTQDPRPTWHFVGTLPVALASLLDSFDRLGGNLSLGQNPWEHPPDPIVKGGMPAVRGYFEAMFSGGTSTVTRPLKVVIIGKETVGKTRYEGTKALVPHILKSMHHRVCGMISRLSFDNAMANVGFIIRALWFSLLKANVCFSILLHSSI